MDFLGNCMNSGVEVLLVSFKCSYSKVDQSRNKLGNKNRGYFYLSILYLFSLSTKRKCILYIGDPNLAIMPILDIKLK